MSRPRYSRLILAASAIALTINGPVLAQTVRVFEDAPSIEQLRAIMIPESLPGAGRTIVMQRPDGVASTVPVQRAAAQVSSAPRTPVQQVSVSEPEPPRPAVKPPTEAKHGTVGFRINFAFDSAVLPDAAHDMMDTVARLMKESPDIKVRIEGHTDAAGPADYNRALSERRALSVGTYLVKQGIDASRLELIGKGMADPLTSNPYDAENRRVQFVRIG